MTTNGVHTVGGRSPPPYTTKSSNMTTNTQLLNIFFLFNLCKIETHSNNNNNIYNFN